MLDLDHLRRNALDAFHTQIGILNCSYAVESLHNPDTAATISAAVNDWMIHDWLEQEPRLRASLVVPSRVPEMAAGRAIGPACTRSPAHWPRSLSQRPPAPRESKAAEE